MVVPDFGADVSTGGRAPAPTAKNGESGTLKPSAAKVASPKQPSVKLPQGRRRKEDARAPDVQQLYLSFRAAVVVLIANAVLTLIALLFIVILGFRYSAVNHELSGLKNDLQSAQEESVQGFYSKSYIDKALAGLDGKYVTPEQLNSVTEDVKATGAERDQISGRIDGWAGQVETLRGEFDPVSMRQEAMELLLGYSDEDYAVALGADDGDGEHGWFGYPLH